MTSAQAEPIVNARQFVAGPASASIPRLDRPYQFANLTIQTDDLLPVTSAAHHDSKLLCLGSLIDPRAGRESTEALLSRVAASSTDFLAFERAVSSLGGRWLMFVRIDGHTRLYPDAAGLKSAFYVKDAQGLWMASQPGTLSLVADTVIDPHLASRLDRAPRADAWPAERTPYRGVKQLLPNHFLDVDTGVARRFWPSRAIAPRTTPEAAAGIAGILHGTIEAGLERYGGAALALSGGYETRTLLACAGHLRKRLSYFTIIDASTPSYEYRTPARLARKMALDYRIVRGTGRQDSAIRVMKQNSGYIWRDPKAHLVSAFGLIDSPVVLLGNASEVCRCEYYEDKPHPTSITPELLAQIIGWGSDSLAVEAFDEWLQTVPTGMNINTLDLFYWETRVGNWCSLDYTVMDSFVETLPVFNCREFFELGLGVPLVDRQVPHELYLSICRAWAPETLELPFNSSTLMRIAKALANRVPSIIKNKSRSLRKRLVGGNPH